MLSRADPYETNKEKILALVHREPAFHPGATSLWNGLFVTVTHLIIMEGWIKIHRKIEKHWIWANPLYTRAWIYCLFRANYEDKKLLVGTKLVPMEQGTFITSIKNFSDATELSIQQTRAFWKLLENDEMITRKSTNSATKITICKYEDYQVEQQTRNKRITNDSYENQHRQPAADEQNTEGDNKRITNDLPQNQQQIKNKEERKKETPIVPFPEFPVPENLDSPKFRKVWFEEWIAYRKEQKYKNPEYTPRGLKSALTNLSNISDGNITTAIQIIRHSISQSYQGLFPLKGGDYGRNKKPRNGARKPQDHFQEVKSEKFRL